MKTPYKVYFLPFSLLFLLSTTLSGQNLNLLWSRVEYGINLGSANLLCQDIDADGKQDIVFSGGEYSAQHAFVANYDGTTLNTKWASPMYLHTTISEIILANVDQDADTEIYLVLQDGTVDVYDGITKKFLQSYQTNFPGVQDAAIADVDNDGHAELVMVADYKLVSFDLVTQQSDWENTDIHAFYLVTGDVDGDGAQEIVVSSNQWNSGNGYVVDGATGTIEWLYLGGFGYALGLADTNNDDVPEIIGLDNGFVTIYDGAFHSPLTQFMPSQNGDIAAMLVTDIEADGHAEIIIGDGQWGKIRCFNAETQQPIWEMYNPDHGVTNIATGDPDGDGTQEVFWGAGATTSGADRLYFFNETTLQEEYRSTDLDGSYFFDAADLDGDGTTEFIVASAASDGGNNGGHLLSYNSNSLALQWDEPLQSSGSTQKVIIAQARNDQQFEIITGYYGLSILDGESRQSLFAAGLNNIIELKEADLNGDGKREIIAADGDGKVTVFGYDGSSFQQLWQSISFYGINAMDIANCDNDPALEIIFSRNNGIIQAFDGQTKLLQWQIQATGNSTAQLAVDDLDGDGEIELLYTAGNSLYFFNGQTQQLLANFYDITQTDILALEIANLDSSSRKEILIVDQKLKIIDSESFLITWESPIVNSNYWDVSLLVKDLFDDQHVDVLLGTYNGVYQFSTASTIPDVVAPRVFQHFPANGAQFQGVNTVPRISFSEIIDPGSLNAANVVLQDAQGNVLAATLSFDSLLFQLSCHPTVPLPAADTITVTLRGSLADFSQNTLDGNNNGIAEGSPLDDYTWHFSTGTGIDNIGPIAIMLNTTPTEGWPGIPVKLQATFSDLSSIATSGIASAEYFVGQIGVTGQGIPFLPTDGNWGSVEEAALGTIATDGFASGQYSIFVHAKDLVGNWGVMVETAMIILPESTTNWPMYGQNAQHTNSNPNCSLEPPLKIKWSKTYENRYMKPVAYANGYLLAPMYHHTTEWNAILHCLDTISGADVWSHEFGNIYTINPATYANGRAYIQTTYHGTNTFLSSFNLLTGDLQWQAPFESQGETYLNPTAADGKIFINGGTYGGIYAFDAVTGQRAWFKSLLQFHNWTPAYHNKVAYAFAGGTLSAHSVLSGQVQWQKDLPFDFFEYGMNTAPVIDTANHLIFATSRNYLHAVHYDSHATVWSQSGNLGVTPALSDGTLYLVRNGKLEARNALTGMLSWTFNGDTELSYPPAVAGDYLFVSSDSHLFAVRRDNGTQAWEYASGGAITLADNLLFLTNPDNVLQAFEHGITSSTPDIAMAASGFKVQPNPVTGQAQLQFSLPNSEQVSIQITDLSGKIIATVLNETVAAGAHTILWNSAGLPDGMYTCRLVAGAISETRKVVVIKG